MDLPITARLYERYAEDVIGGKPEHFDAIELQGVRGNANDPDSIEVDNQDPEFYSVYLHYKPGQAAGHEGVQCCGDFEDPEQARLYAAELSTKYGWPLYDYAPKLVAA